MEANESRSERHRKIYSSANFDLQYIIPNLCKLVGYRERVAQEIIKSNNEESLEVLNELYDNVENDMKKYLGL